MSRFAWIAALVITSACHRDAGPPSSPEPPRPSPEPPRLELKIVDDGSTFMRELGVFVSGDRDAKSLGIEKRLEAWTIESPALDRDKGGHRSDTYLTAANTKDASGRAILEGYLARLPEKLRPDDAHEFVYERVLPDEGERVVYWRTYYVFRNVLLDSSAVSSASIDRDPSGPPTVWLTLDPAGRAALLQLTTNAVGAKVAILIDGDVSSAPVIQSPIDTDRFQLLVGLHGGDPQQEAEQLSDRFR